MILKGWLGISKDCHNSNLMEALGLESMRQHFHVQRLRFFVRLMVNGLTSDILLGTGTQASTTPDKIAEHVYENARVLPERELRYSRTKELDRGIDKQPCGPTKEDLLDLE